MIVIWHAQVSWMCELILLLLRLAKAMNQSSNMMNQASNVMPLTAEDSMASEGKARQGKATHDIESQYHVLYESTWLLPTVKSSQDKLQWPPYQAAGTLNQRNYLLMMKKILRN